MIADQVLFARHTRLAEEMRTIQAQLTDFFERGLIKHAKAKVVKCTTMAPGWQSEFLKLQQYAYFNQITLMKRAWQLAGMIAAAEREIARLNSKLDPQA